MAARNVLTHSMGATTPYVLPFEHSVIRMVYHIINYLQRYCTCANVPRDNRAPLRLDRSPPLCEPQLSPRLCVSLSLSSL